MALHPISDNMDNLSIAEKVIAVLIDNQLISGLDAINVLKEIWNNKKEEPIKTLLPDIPVVPHQKTNPIKEEPIWEPYKHPKILYGETGDNLTSQYTTKDVPNVTTTVYNGSGGNSSSITWEEWNKNHLTASDNPLHESKVFNKK